MVTDKNAGALVVEEGVQYWCSLNLSSLTAERETRRTAAQLLGILYGAVVFHSITCKPQLTVLQFFGVHPHRGGAALKRFCVAALTMPWQLCLLVCSQALCCQFSSLFHSIYGS